MRERGIKMQARRVQVNRGSEKRLVKGLEESYQAEAR